MINSTKTIVYAGPSINNKIRQLHQSFIYRQPAQQGDITQCVIQGEVDTILLIDGYYQTVPSVWHKEIIYALNKGIRVIGCSSLGAIRAVELEKYGMLGHGKIFNWYRSGIISRDPDVAVTHAGEEDDYKALTVPIVNIKSTLESCGFEIKEDEINEVISCCRKIFFEQRTIRTVINQLGNCQLDQELKAKLQRLFTDRYKDQKQEDSIETLIWLETTNPISQTVTEPLNETVYWKALKANDTYVRPSATGLLQTKQAMLTFQLCEQPENFMKMREDTWRIELALWIAEIYRIEPNLDIICEMRKLLLARLNINETHLPEWLKNKGLDINDFKEHIKTMALVKQVRTHLLAKSPLCNFNKTHYRLLALNGDSDNIFELFEDMDKQLKSKSYSAIDEISGTENRMPLEMNNELERYRTKYLLEKNIDSTEYMITLPVNYVIAFAKLYQRYREIIDDLIRRAFSKNA